jgi:hypothetical protein
MALPKAVALLRSTINPSLNEHVPTPNVIVPLRIVPLVNAPSTFPIVELSP